MTIASLLFSINAWYILLTCLLYGLGYFFRNSLGPITEGLERDLDATSSDIGLMSSLIYASYFVMQLVVGVLLEVYSFQIVLIVAAFGLGITSVLFYMAQSVISAAIIRFFAGIFISPTVIAVMTIGSQRYGRTYVALCLGIASFSSFTFQISATTLQAYIYEKYNVWRETYLLIGCVSLLCAVIILSLSIYEQIVSDYSDTSSEDVDTSAVELKKTTEIAPDEPLISSSSVKQKVFDCKKFLFTEKKRIGDKSNSKVRILIHSLKKSVINYRNWLLGIWGFGMCVIIYAFNGLWLIPYMTLKFKYSTATSTFVAGLFFISSGIGALMFGKLSTIVARRKILLYFGELCSFASVVIIYCPANTHISIIVVLNLLSGLSIGMIPIVYQLCREYNAYFQCGDAATGMIQLIFNAAGFIAPFMIGNLLDYHWEVVRNGDDFNEENDRNYIVSDYNFAFTIIPVVLVIACIVSIMFPETYGKNIDMQKV